jgi:hypothetical protein
VYHNYSFKSKYVRQKNYHICRCGKITRYSKGGDGSYVLQMVAVVKMAGVVVVNKLLPCVVKHGLHHIENSSGGQPCILLFL